MLTEWMDETVTPCSEELTGNPRLQILICGVKEEMRELVVLVGPAGSGKSTFRRRHPEWAVVSKDDIRRNVFGRDFDLLYEDAVARVFAATLVEAVDSPAEVVCVDNTNLTRAERSEMIEVARASGRVPIAYVMPHAPVDVLYKRKLDQLALLASNNPGVVVGGFPEERYLMMYNRYEEVDEEEGFVKVFREVEPLPQSRKRARTARKKRRSTTLRRLDALPLFSQ